jgi:hypothetical protein
MINHWAIFFLGVFIGANLGILILACCMVSSRVSRWEEYQDELKKNLDHE